MIEREDELVIEEEESNEDVWMDERVQKIHTLENAMR